MKFRFRTVVLATVAILTMSLIATLQLITNQRTYYCDRVFQERDDELGLSGFSSSERTKLRYILEELQVHNRTDSLREILKAKINVRVEGNRKQSENVAERHELPISPLEPGVVKKLWSAVNAVVRSKVDRSRQTAKTLNLHASETRPLSSWKRFHKGINQYELYGEENQAIDELLKDLATKPVVSVVQKVGGTQLKLVLWYSDDDGEDRAIWKPMRTPRDTETLPNQFYFTDYERHNAEIAAFHLDRLLGFRRVPPHAGKVTNITRDFLPVAEDSLRKTFFTSPDGNACFHGDCSYYCDTGHAVCGTPHDLEGSLAAMLPSVKKAPRKTWPNPWRRSYSKRRRAAWEKNDSYCDDVRWDPPYDSSRRRLLDIMDLAVFDFLIANMDRHHYETFAYFGNETFIIHMDNGRGFGRSRVDEMSILAPILQCCLIRRSTLVKFLEFHQSSRTLSERMRDSLKRDQLYPILTDAHLHALDRRLNKTLKTIYECLVKVDGDRTEDLLPIIVDDGF